MLQFKLNIDNISLLNVIKIKNKPYKVCKTVRLGGKVLYAVVKNNNDIYHITNTTV